MPSRGGTEVESGRGEKRKSDNDEIEDERLTESGAGGTSGGSGMKRRAEGDGMDEERIVQMVEIDGEKFEELDEMVAVKWVGEIGKRIKDAGLPQSMHYELEGEWEEDSEEISAEELPAARGEEIGFMVKKGQLDRGAREGVLGATRTWASEREMGRYQKGHGGALSVGGKGLQRQGLQEGRLVCSDPAVGNYSVADQQGRHEDGDEEKSEVAFH